MEMLFDLKNYSYILFLIWVSKDTLSQQNISSLDNLIENNWQLPISNFVVLTNTERKLKPSMAYWALS